MDFESQLIIVYVGDSLQYGINSMSLIPHKIKKKIKLFIRKHACILLEFELELQGKI